MQPSLCRTKNSNQLLWVQVSEGHKNFIFGGGKLRKTGQTTQCSRISEFVSWALIVSLPLIGLWFYHLYLHVSELVIIGHMGGIRWPLKSDSSDAIGIKFPSPLFPPWMAPLLSIPLSVSLGLPAPFRRVNTRSDPMCLPTMSPVNLKGELFLISAVVVGGLVAKLCPALCDPINSWPPSSSVQEISQERILELGCHFLLQGIFPTWRSNLCVLHYRWILYQLSH